MENNKPFGSLTTRMQAFREEVLDEKPYVDAERAILATEVYKENQNQPRVMVRALMLKKILENMSLRPFLSINSGRAADGRPECGQV